MYSILNIKLFKFIIYYFVASFLNSLKLKYREYVKRIYICLKQVKCFDYFGEFQTAVNQRK